MRIVHNIHTALACAAIPPSMGDSTMAELVEMLDRKRTP
jgi:hypothetical protein